MSRVSWFQGDRQRAVDAARQAVAVLEADGSDPHELAYAYSNLAQLAMLDHDVAQARQWGNGRWPWRVVRATPRSSRTP